MDDITQNDLPGEYDDLGDEDEFYDEDEDVEEPHCMGSVNIGDIVIDLYYLGNDEGTELAINHRSEFGIPMFGVDGAEEHWGDVVVAAYDALCQEYPDAMRIEYEKGPGTTLSYFGSQDILSDMPDPADAIEWMVQIMSDFISDRQ